MAARISVQKTLTDYGRFVDTGRLDRLAGRFAPTCHYDMGGGAVLTDRPAILQRGEEVKAMVAASPNFGGRVRHHITPVSVEFADTSHAKATSYFLTMGRSGPDHWGVYRDELVYLDGAWLFARRVVSVEGHSPDSPAADEDGPH